MGQKSQTTTAWTYKKLHILVAKLPTSIGDWQISEPSTVSWPLGSFSILQERDDGHHRRAFLDTAMAQMVGSFFMPNFPKIFRVRWSWSLLHLGKFTTPQDAHLREDLKQFFRIGFLDFVSKSLKMWNLHQFLFWAIQRGAKRSRKRMVYLILVSLVWRGPDWPAKCGEPEHSLNKKKPS